MNTPTLETERLILRKFTENDLEALYKIYSDKEVNRFLPWFPLKTLEDTKPFYEKQFASKYAQKCAYNYGICLKKENYPIGYECVLLGKRAAGKVLKRICPPLVRGYRC